MEGHQPIKVEKDEEDVQIATTANRDTTIKNEVDIKEEPIRWVVHGNLVKREYSRPTETQQVIDEDYVRAGKVNRVKRNMINSCSASSQVTLKAANCGIKTQDGEPQQETNCWLRHRNFAHKRKYHPLVVDHDFDGKVKKTKRNDGKSGSASTQVKLKVSRSATSVKSKPRHDNEAVVGRQSIGENSKADCTGNAAITCGNQIKVESDASIGYMVAHETMDTREKPKKRLACDKTIFGSDNLVLHQCKVCLKTFFARRELLEHEKMKGCTRRYKCRMCDQAYHRKDHLMLHERMHACEPRLACRLCDRKFSAKYCLETHQQLHIGERPYECEMCLRMFDSTVNLETHKRTHNMAKRPYKCKVCWKTFSSKRQLQRHDTECDVCLKSFTLKSKLVAHAETHTSERPYNCVGREEVFSTRTKSEAHEQSDNDEQPIEKEEGPEPSSPSSYLLIHERKIMQKMKRLYKCSLCRKTFSIRTHLLRHEQMHTGELSHVCLVCDKAFYTKSYLIKHAQIHAAVVL